MSSKSEIRQKLIKRRNNLTAQFISDASNLIIEKIFELSYYQNSRKIAAYFAINSEVSTDHLFLDAWQNNKTTYLPLIKNPQSRHMSFYEFDSFADLKKNQWSILEPPEKAQHLILPEHLDVVFLPLVAFDLKGNRLGMGKGFYDTCFSFRKTLAQPNSSPLLIGLAYEFQKVDELIPDPWDITLDGVITEEEGYFFPYSKLTS